MGHGGRVDKFCKELRWRNRQVQESFFFSLLDFEMNMMILFEFD